MSERGSAPWFQEVVEVDVSGTCAVDGRLTMVATVHPPPAEAPTDGAIVLFALPAGGRSRGYFDMRFIGRDANSHAEHHAKCALALVAVDHLGVGASTTEVCANLRADVIAAAKHAAVLGIADLPGVERSHRKHAQLRLNAVDAMGTTDGVG